MYSQQEQEVLRAMGCCPRCGEKADTLYRTGGASVHPGEAIIHCGCIWNPEERNRAILAVKTGIVNLMH
jgi:hypothetical protein